MSNKQVIRQLQGQVNDLQRGNKSRGAQLVRSASIPAGGEGCETQNTILDITLFGNPTGGTFDIPLEINGVQELMTLNWDDTSTDVATELATHSELASSDLDVTGGPFPTVTMRVEFIGDQEGINIIPPIADWTDLTGGTGKAIIIAQVQRGHV